MRVFFKIIFSSILGAVGIGIGHLIFIGFCAFFNGIWEQGPEIIIYSPYYVCGLIGFICAFNFISKYSFSKDLENDFFRRIGSTFVGALIGLGVAFIVDLLFIDTYIIFPVLLVYILCILLGGRIGYIIEKHKQEKPKNKKESKALKKKEQRIIDFDDHLAFVLDNTLKFVDAYLTEVPGEWLFMHISKIREEVVPNYHYYEYIEIQLTVGTWYNGIFLKHEEEKDYMESIYTFDAKENTFTYKMLIGTSTNCFISPDLLRKKLFDSLDAYERTRPNRKLTRTDFGVSHRWNLDK